MTMISAEKKRFWPLECCCSCRFVNMLMVFPYISYWVCLSFFCFVYLNLFVYLLCFWRYYYHCCGLIWRPIVQYTLVFKLSMKNVHLVVTGVLLSSLLFRGKPNFQFLIPLKNPWIITYPHWHLPKYNQSSLLFGSIAVAMHNKLYSVLKKCCNLYCKCKI